MSVPGIGPGNLRSAAGGAKTRNRSRSWSHFSEIERQMNGGLSLRSKVEIRLIPSRAAAEITS